VGKGPPQAHLSVVAVTKGGSLFVDRFKSVCVDKSTFWINAARISAIIAGVSLLYSPTVASGALIATYVAFVASGQAVARLRQVFARPAVYWGAAFLCLVLIGMTYASVPWSDRWTDLLKWRTILWFSVLLSIFEDERWKNRLLVTFIVGTAVPLVASFVAAAGWVTLWRSPDALLRNAVTQGMGFAVASLACLWMFLEKTLQEHIRWIAPLLGLSYAANMAFITTGRSGYVILGIGCALLLLWKASHVQRLAIVVGLFLAAILAFSLSARMQSNIALGVDQWVQEPESTTLTNMASRRVYYLNTLEIIQDHWLIGTGTGGFKQAYTDQVTRKYEPSNWRSEPIGDPHNQYLAVFAEYGIGGLAVFVVWIVAIARDQCALPKYRKLALAILFGWCVTSLFSSHFRTFAEGHLLTTFLGVLLSAPAVKAKREMGLREPLSS
jgi:O-antigen ligase